MKQIDSPISYKQRKSTNEHKPRRSLTSKEKTHGNRIKEEKFRESLTTKKRFASVSVSHVFLFLVSEKRPGEKEAGCVRSWCGGSKVTVRMLGGFGGGWVIKGNGDIQWEV